METITALILAAGCGRRAQTPYPKQYMEISGIPVLRRSILPFLKHPHIKNVLVVIAQGDQQQYSNAVQGLSLPAPIMGGSSRTESSRRGISHVTTDWVLIHDGARPFVDTKLIDTVIGGLEKHQAVVPVIPVLESVKDSKGKNINRQHIHIAQTPQGFYTQCIKHAYAHCNQDFSDDASAVENFTPIHTVAGSQNNTKITFSEDLTPPTKRSATLEPVPPLTEEVRLSAFGAPHISHTPRIGYGYDVHAFTEGTHILLCGVKIPHNKSLAAHSDGDVALHALTDALYGAMGEGDIGKHFPPTDPRWKNADSFLFLRHALSILHKKGGHMYNADITIVCEYPKIAPHSALMQKIVAESMHVHTQQVSIKATTSEKLGFTGRLEGIACHANILIGLPHGVYNTKEGKKDL